MTRPDDLRGGLWRDPAIPKAGWECIAVNDQGEPSDICEMCQVAEIRYVHVMVHPDHAACCAWAASAPAGWRAHRKPPEPGSVRCGAELPGSIDSSREPGGDPHAATSGRGFAGFTSWSTHGASAGRSPSRAGTAGKPTRRRPRPRLQRSRGWSGSGSARGSDGSLLAGPTRVAEQRGIALPPGAADG